MNIKSTVWVSSLFLLGLAATALAAYLAFQIASSVAVQPGQAELAALYDVRPIIVTSLHPEPVESIVFLVSIAVGVLFMAALGLVAGRTSPRTIFIVPAAAAGLATICVLLWWMAGIGRASFLATVPSALYVSVAGHPVATGVIAAGICALLLVLYRSALLSRKLILAVLSAPILVYAAYMLIPEGDFYLFTAHNEVFTFPVVQEWLGQGVYLAPDSQKSQYGLYPFYLMPLWMLAGGPSTVLLSTTMVAIFLFSFMSLILFVTRVAYNPLLTGILAVLGLTVSLLQFGGFWPLEPYYQFFSIRAFFPAIAFLLMLSVRPTWRSVLACYFVLGFGLLWNLESGVVALVSFAAFTVLSQATGRAGIARFLFGHAVAAVVGIVAANALILALYVMRHGAMPSVAGPLESIRAFSSGLGALPMPVPGPWIVHFIIYGAALFWATRTLARSPTAQERMHAAASIALALAGLVWMRYYQGRSHAQQLLLVSWPALACLGLLIDGWLRRARASRVLASVVTGLVLAPISVWAVVGPDQLFDRHSRERQDRSVWTQTVDRIVQQFQDLTPSKSDRLLVIAPYAYAVNLRLGVPSPVTAAGICQIWFNGEHRQVLEALADPDTKMAVFDDGFRCPRLTADDEDIAAILASDYSPIFPTTACGVPAVILNRIFVKKGLEDVQRSSLAARQSSTRQSSVACLAIDGNTDGSFEDGSVTHTGKDKLAFWEMDLGQVTQIRQVNLWNRSDGRERLKDFWVLVSDKPMLDADLETLKARPDVSSVFHPGSFGDRLDVDFNRAARYVRVQLSGEDYLNLAEVTVNR